MTDSLALLSRVRAALANVEGLAEQRMFGGTAMLINGHLCVSCRADRIMCRIDPALHDWAAGQPGCAGVSMGGRLYRGYVHIEAEALQTDADLREWLDRALAHNATLPPKSA